MLTFYCCFISFGLHLTTNAVLKSGKPLDMRRYKLCCSFGLNVDQRLKSKKSLDHKDFDEVCRAICVSIIQHTHNPSSDAIRKIVGLFFERFLENFMGLKTKVLKPFNPNFSCQNQPWSNCSAVVAMLIVCCDFRLLVLVCEANVIRSINTNLNLKNKFN